MRQAKDDPDQAEQDSGGEVPMYTVEQFRLQIARLKRTNAQLRNALRLASTLSQDARVKATIEAALADEEERN